MSRQTWFITGASSGLGAATAKAALRAGHRVAATARDSARLSSLAEAGSERVLALSMDLTVPDQIEAAVAAAESWNGIDVLVNNAALGYLAAVEEGEDAKIRTLFETNVFGLAHTIRAALPGMRRRAAGSIINVSSFNGVVAMPSLGYYSASKFAVEGLTEALAQEVAALGIKVSAVEPGGIRTGIVERNLRSPPIDDYRPSAHAIIDLLETTGMASWLPAILIASPTSSSGWRRPATCRAASLWARTPGPGSLPHWMRAGPSTRPGRTWRTPRPSLDVGPLGHAAVASSTSNGKLGK